MKSVITFGKYQNNIVLESCVTELETEKALLIRCIKDDEFRNEYQFWIPKSVITKAKDFVNYIHLPFWFTPNLFKI